MKNINEIIKEVIKINEITDEIYNLIKLKYSDSRIVMTKKDEIDFYSTKNQLIPSFKPKGLWYGIGIKWIEWVRTVMREWEHDNVFELKINQKKIKKITNFDELIKFSEEYNYVADDEFSKLYQDPDNYRRIDWPKVAETYSGIEISPYIGAARMSVHWYYPWDVASGCIWENDAITSINKINYKKIKTI